MRIKIIFCFLLFVAAKQAKPFTLINCTILYKQQIEINKDTTEKHNFYYGTASFYSKSLEGTRTSNDETFSHKKLTCASNRFKIGTWLRVTNLSNEKSVVVRVNDRMHPKMDKKGRIVDLSYEGAKRLSFVKKGITKVKVEVVPKGTTE